MSDSELIGRVRNSMRRQCQEWKPSWCCYKQWVYKKEFGHKRPMVPLCFSKSGDPVMEKRYSTHYVDRKRIAELKAQKASGS